MKRGFMRVDWNTKGVSVVVGAVLLIGVLLAVSAVFYREYTFYSWRQAETANSASVELVFFDIKSKLEDISPGRSRSFEISLTPTPPFLAPSAGSWGVLTVSGENGTSSGYIQVDLNNVFYSRQSYVYEDGAVILIQPENEMMLSPPPLVVILDNGGDVIRVYVHRVKIVGSGSRSGGGTCPLLLVCEDVATASGYSENVVIRINSSHRTAWGAYLQMLYAEFLSKGYNPVLNLENLELIIGGKDPEAADIQLFEENLIIRAHVP
jgi:hypothetical protein